MKHWDWPERKAVFAGKRGERELLVRRMREDEVDLVMRLQTRVLDTMPDSSLLAETDRDEIAESVQLDLCLGAFDGHRLAAFALMVVNRASETRNTGQKNGLVPEECVSFDTAFVDPDYRGLGLQKYLLSAREEVAHLLGAKYALVTVAPDNEFSLKNVMNHGFEIMARKRLYGNRDRYILKKNLHP